MNTDQNPILNWLTQERYTVKQEVRAGFKYVYSASAQGSTGYPLSVSQEDGSDRITISVGFALSDSDQTAVSQSSAGAFRVMKEISLALHSTPVLFNIEQKDAALTKVAVYQVLYADGLSKDRVMTALFQVEKASALVLLLLSDYLPKTSPPGESQPVSQAGAGATCTNCGAKLKPNATFCSSCGQRVG